MLWRSRAFPMMKRCDAMALTLLTLALFCSVWVPSAFARGARHAAVQHVAARHRSSAAISRRPERPRPSSAGARRERLRPAAKLRLAHAIRPRERPARRPEVDGISARARHELLVRPRLAAPVLIAPVVEAAAPLAGGAPGTDGLAELERDGLGGLPARIGIRGKQAMPPPLRGSHEILVHQNQVADRDGLTRVQDDDDLLEMRRHAALVGLPVGGGMQVDPRLPADRRYCRPWTAIFLQALARAHAVQFHTALQVNSAVRTVAIQQRLLRTNGNAAPIAGETASPHLTGQAVDVAKKGLSLAEIAWMRGYLLPLVQAGMIDVEEEFQQSCFHISVYRRYVSGGAAPLQVAVTHRDAPAALAIALR